MTGRSWFLIGLIVAELSVSAPLKNSFEIDVPEPPATVGTEGAALLVYELHLTNFSATPKTVRLVRVLAGSNPVGEFQGAALWHRVALLGGSAPQGQDVVVEPGRRGIIFLELAVPGAEVPATLCHEVVYSTAGEGNDSPLRGPCVTVKTAAPQPFAPPLRGGPWVAVHDPNWTRGHRRVFYTVAGKAHIPARFAVDFVRLDAAGHTTGGDPDRVADTQGYGDDVLAVADARVAGVRNDMSEPLLISDRRPHEIAEDAGNFVALRLHDGRYAFYEHLKPGSIRVKQGEAVVRGEVIGSLGFSGESTGPHLHFHVADGPDTLDAEGLPFSIDRFRLLGRYENIDTLGREPWQPLNDGIEADRLNEWPGSNVVIQFRLGGAGR
jgi:hypothetical protein